MSRCDLYGPLDGGYNPPSAMVWSISCLTGLSPMSFEEQGVVKNPVLWRLRSHRTRMAFPARFQRLRILHELGEERIQLDSESALLTRRKDGTLVLAVWNYAPPEQSGSPRKITWRFKNTNQSMPRFRGWTASTGTFARLTKKNGKSALPYAETDSGTSQCGESLRARSRASPARRVNHNSAQPWAGGNRTPSKHR